MKKLLIILGAVGIFSSASLTVISCGPKENTAVNLKYDRLTLEEYNKAWETHNAIQQEFIKGLATQGAEVGVTEQQLKEAKIGNIEESIKAKIATNFDSKLITWGITDFQKYFDVADLDVTFTQLDDYNPESKSRKFTTQFGYKGSDKFFKVTGALRAYGFKTIDTLNEYTINKVFDMADQVKNEINSNGFFLKLTFVGEKQANGLAWKGNQKVYVEEINKRATEYFFGYLRSTGIVSINLRPGPTNFNIDTVTGNYGKDKFQVIDDYWLFKEEKDFGPHSMVGDARFSWKTETQNERQWKVTGSFIQDLKWY